MNRTTRRLVVAGCTVSFVGLGVAPASADIITPNGITAHATPICDGESNTLTLQVRPDPERAHVQIALRNRATGQDYGWATMLPGVAIADWREYTWPGLQLSDDTGRGQILFTDVEVRVYYHWVDVSTGQEWEVEEVLPDQCLI